MKNKSLMVSLGHNSSALYYDGIDLIGYEEERLNNIKSYSGFPKLSLERIVSLIDINDCTMFISHWYDEFDLFKIKDDKHLDLEYLKIFISKYNINLVCLNENFTHHDAHAYSSLAFFKNNIENKIIDKYIFDKIHFLVIDGFGNKQEVISIYSSDMINILNEKCDLQLEYRLKGYNLSLGLMYQYATSFCGMKENQDEYKFLGYESHINKTLNKELIKKLDLYILRFTNYTFSRIIENDEKYSLSENYINIDDLKSTKVFLNNIFKDTMRLCNIDDYNGFNSRVIVGYFIQNVIEIIVSKLIDSFNIKNLCVSGGVFYNVKLNNSILKKIDGLFSIIPLCGDQGAAIGMYQKEFSDFNFKDLCLGNRDKIDIKLLLPYEDISKNIIISKNKDVIIDNITKLLKSDKIVNFIEGNMEFGPRALCQTSTFSLPNKNNVEIINTLNKRNTVMPMAPVMLEKNLKTLFNEDLFDRVIGSDKFMIITYDYKEDINMDKYEGVMHKYPKEDLYSGRPQIITEDSNKVIKNVLENLDNNIKCLVNTSFNVHGKPILFDYKSILEDFKFQCDIADKNNLDRPYLVLYV